MRRSTYIIILVIVVLAIIGLIIWATRPSGSSDDQGLNNNTNTNQNVNTNTNTNNTNSNENGEYNSNTNNTNNTNNSNANTTQANIQVTNPTSGSEVGLPLAIAGQARVFENTLNYRLRDANGTVLAEGIAVANSPDVGQYGPFSVTVNYPAPKGTTGTVEVFDFSAKDGSEIDKVTIPVKFQQNVQATTLKVYLMNTAKAGNSTSCSLAYPVTRRVPKTTSVAQAALQELLAGPTSLDTKAGYSTAINQGVTLNSVVIKNGVATADFNEQLEQSVGGSCRVAEIRAQITQTLKQFPSVKSVVISINGRTEDILQP